MSSSSRMDRIRQRLSPNGGRIDLFIADTRPRNKAAADILVGYSIERGAPERSEVIAFVRKEYGGKVDVLDGSTMDHGRVNTNNGAVHCIAEAITDRRPIDQYKVDPKSYRNITAMKLDDTGPIAGTAFQHVRTAEVWDIEDDDSGGRMMVRRVEEDIDQILQARAQTVGIKVASSLRLDKMNITAGAHMLDIGDRVTYYMKGTQCSGTVATTSRRGGRMHVSVRCDKDGSVNVLDEGEIVSVIQKNPAINDSREEKNTAFWEKVYPTSPEFARRLTDQ